MKTHKTKITLLSWTQNPLETIYAEWVQSRTQDPVPLPSTLAAEWRVAEMLNDLPPEERQAAERRKIMVLEVFEEVVAMKMPLGETLDFVFLIEHCPIVLREQLVRHRIGHKFGDRLGADIIPDLAGNSSFWSQTTRITNLGKFATEGEYLTPDWLEENGDQLMKGYKTKLVCPECGGKLVKTDTGSMVNGQRYFNGLCENGHRTSDPEEVPGGTISEFYHEQMKWIQAAYRRLVDAGMPLQDARNILPVALQHRMTWKVNLQALMHVLSRRGCWLAQLSIWESVIHGIVEELSTKVHPTFRRLIDPPCIGADGEYNKCAFGKENEDLVSKGEYPPCSLWINREHRTNQHPLNSSSRGAVEIQTITESRMPRYKKMMEKYTQLWQRDPRTGKRIQLT